MAISIMRDQLKLTKTNKIMFKWEDTAARKLIKIVTYTMKNMPDITKEDILNAGETLNLFSEDCRQGHWSEVTPYNANEIKPKLKPKDMSQVKIFHCGIKSKFFHNKKNHAFYLDFSGTSPLSVTGAQFQYLSSSSQREEAYFTVFNGKYLVALANVYRLLKNQLPRFIDPTTDKMFDTEETLSLFLNEYILKHGDSELPRLFCLDAVFKVHLVDKWYLKKDRLDSGRFFTYALDATGRLIEEMLVWIYEEELNIQLMTEYERRSSSDYAKSFQTKKNIPEKIQKVMKHNAFMASKKFSYVELDELVDIHKFKEIENEWTKMANFFQFGETLPNLRFRRLGKHKASGVFFPTHCCISIDIRNVTSFFHEFAHYLDYFLKRKENEPTINLSMEEAFRPILHAYRQSFSKHLKALSNEVLQSQYQRRQNYFLTPTEVFARSFEIWLSQSGVSTSFLQKPEEYANALEYQALLDEDVLFLILDYFKTHSILPFGYQPSDIYQTMSQPKNQVKKSLPKTKKTPPEKGALVCEQLDIFSII